MTQQNEGILHETTSLCPVCLERIPADYIARGDEVWFNKNCEEHGSFETLFWHGVESFNHWNQPNKPQAPKNPAQAARQGCPYDCGICENHKQATCCVLLEVTSRCNLNCPICFASAGDEGTDPSLETIAGWYDMLLDRGGPFNIQLSGGEPTMRDDLAAIIRLGKEKGFNFFQLNTNGLRIADDPTYLHELKEAGLKTVFLQFDSPYAEATRRIRGADIIQAKKQVIINCEKENLGVVLVPTVVRESNSQDVGAVLEFAAANMPTVRGVHFQPMSYFGRYGETPEADSRITLPDLMLAMETQTNGKLKAADFYPGGAEHPLCSCNADYEVDAGEWSLIKKTKPKCCCCSSEADNTSDIARKAVAEKWSAGINLAESNLGEGFDVSALDEFLERQRKHRLAISAMAFQDVWTVDLERLERCYINIVSQDGRLVPFCSYNLTSAAGEALYRRNRGRENESANQKRTLPAL